MKSCKHACLYILTKKQMWCSTSFNINIKFILYDDYYLFFPSISRKCETKKIKIAQTD